MIQFVEETFSSNMNKYLMDAYYAIPQGNASG
jgi:hypothetical protein